MINIILDLDETLINTHLRRKFTAKHYNRAKLFRWKPMGKKYIVVARPGLDGFLDWLFLNFNVSIWTAATRSYAMFVVKKFITRKKHRIPIHIFSSAHCEFSQQIGSSHKDLRFLYVNFPHIYTKQNTVIIDDRTDVCKSQKKNSILIKPFLFLTSNSYKDNNLLKLKHQLKKKFNLV